MEIRKAQRHELNILEKLARAIWPSTYSDIISAAQIEFMLSWMYSEQTLLTQFDQGHEFYILSVQNTDLGFLALEWISSATDNKQHILKINKLYILSQQQNKGFGKALIQKAIQRAAANNVSEIILQVNKANKAKDFYAHLGFDIKEEAIFDIGNGFVMDDYIMHYKL
jgi:ribosomal protein S18 acetylase RimI-like enzyme